MWYSYPMMKRQRKDDKTKDNEYAAKPNQTKQKRNH